jgi:hypothetical protein
MKIKTVVSFILWLGNTLTLQTISGKDPDPASPPFFPGRLCDVDPGKSGSRLDCRKEETPAFARKRSGRVFQPLVGADTKPL